MPKCDFIETAPAHGCSPVHLLDIVRTTFNENTSGRLLLESVIERAIKTSTKSAKEF